VGSAYMFENFSNLLAALNDVELDEKISEFFRNSLEQKIGFSANKFAKYDHDELIRILYALYSWASIDASGAGGGLNKSCKGAENFKKFLRENFNDDCELRSIIKWLEIIGLNLQKSFGKIRSELQNAIIAESYNCWLEEIKSDDKYMAYRLVINFVSKDNRFLGMQIKTAALFFKVLIKDLKFFTDFDFDKKEIFIPLDRVNLRMLTYFLTNLYTNADLENILFGYNSLTKYNHISQLWFNFVCKYLRDNNQAIIPLINFENLWYIGHFYHENMKKAPNRNDADLAVREENGELSYPVCSFRKALKYGDYFVNVQRSTFEAKCPFLKYDCSYDFEIFNRALNIIKS